MTVATEPTPQRFKPLEVVTFPIEGSLPPQNLEAARQRADVLRQFKKTNDADEGQAIEEAKRLATERTGMLGKHEADGMRVQFGMGETKVNDDGSVEPPPADKPEAKSAYENAKLAIDNLRNVELYGTIQAEAQKTNKKPEDILKELQSTGRVEAGVTWTNIRTSSLDAILQNTVVQSLIGNDLRGLAQTVQRDFIDQALAQDPELRKRVITRFREIAQKSKNLPEIKRDEATVKAEKTRDEAQKQQDAAFEALKQNLKDADIMLDDAQLDSLKAMLTEGRSPDYLLRHLQERVLNSKVFKDFDEFQKVARAAAEAATEENWLKSHVSVKVTKSGVEYYTDIPDMQDLMRTHKSSLEEHTATIQNFNARLSSEPLLRQQYETYARTVNLLSNENAEGAMKHLRKASEQQGIVKKQQEVIEERKDEDAKMRRQSEAERQRQEWELITELEGVLGESIGDTLIARSEQMSQLHAERLEKVGIADEEKRVLDAVTRRWIEDNSTTRSRIVHRDNIGDDMRFVAYHGDEGIKRLVVRELGYTTNEGGGTQNWRNLNFNKLTTDQQNTLKRIYDAQGTMIRDKLFTDYFIAKSAGWIRRSMRSGIGRYQYTGEPTNLWIRPHEWENLQRHYGEAIDTGLKTSKEMSSVVSKLKEQGATKKFGLKWLLLLIATLGLSGVVRAAQG